MTGETAIVLEQLPNYEEVVSSFFLMLTQFILFGAIITGVANVMKKPLAILGSWFFIIPILIGVGFMILINYAWPSLFALTPLQAGIIGGLVGLEGIALYKLGVGNTEDNSTQALLDKRDIKSIHDTESLPKG